MKLLSSLFTLTLCAPALAGDVIISIDGTVFANSYGSGPFAAAAVGSPANLTLEVFVPGTDVVPGQLTNYAVDVPTFAMTAGGTLGASAGFDFALMNDFPVADRMGIDFTPIGGGYFFESTFSDSSGTALSSTDILAESGSWTAADFPSTQTWYVAGNGGQIEFALTSITIGQPDITSNYCTPAIGNSTGQPGTISAFGSQTASENDVRLVAESLPPNQFGYYLNSQTQGLVMPPGSQGNLCLSGQIGRYTANVSNSGASGRIELQLDLTQTPTPGGPVSVLAGETWNFQLWYRDANPGPTSNFTDALSIQFL